ncbi:jg21226 [Pararge aegeria aegeria]|uniref:Jg21226 protein n=1 Tax=Pararge aegeria aegeria TaxID=348720 RepID=A0A8S4R6Q4_9NEOP|nr:jg21226 [Pararge aegeria aegeria]
MLHIQIVQLAMKRAMLGWSLLDRVPEPTLFKELWPLNGPGRVTYAVAPPTAAESSDSGLGTAHWSQKLRPTTSSIG